MNAEKKDYDALWKEYAKETFEKFVEEHIGYKEGGDRIPACYNGCGSYKFCKLCPYA